MAGIDCCSGRACNGRRSLVEGNTFCPWGCLGHVAARARDPAHLSSGVSEPARVRVHPSHCCNMPEQAGPGGTREEMVTSPPYEMGARLIVRLVFVRLPWKRSKDSGTYTSM